MRPLKVRPILLAYCLLVFFFSIEPFLRQGKAACSLKEGPADRGSTSLIGASFGLSLIALLVAPLLNRRKIGHFNSKTLAWSGIVSMLTGLMLRIWAVRELEAYFTRTLQTSTEQRLVSDGPYRLIRHPGYLADLLLSLSAGCATAN